jgi:hypothetical protein
MHFIDADYKTWVKYWLSFALVIATLAFSFLMSQDGLTTAAATIVLLSLHPLAMRELFQTRQALHNGYSRDSTEVSLHPFADSSFYEYSFIGNEEATGQMLLINQGKHQRVIGLAGIALAGIARNVQPNLWDVVRNLSIHGIPFTYETKYVECQQKSEEFAKGQRELILHFYTHAVHSYESNARDTFQALVIKLRTQLDTLERNFQAFSSHYRWRGLGTEELQNALNPATLVNSRGNGDLRPDWDGATGPPKTTPVKCPPGKKPAPKDKCRYPWTLGTTALMAFLLLWLTLLSKSILSLPDQYEWKTSALGLVLLSVLIGAVSAIGRHSYYLDMTGIPGVRVIDPFQDYQFRVSTLDPELLLIEYPDKSLIGVRLCCVQEINYECRYNKLRVFRNLQVANINSFNQQFYSQGDPTAVARFITRRVKEKKIREAVHRYLTTFAQREGFWNCANLWGVVAFAANSKTNVNEVAERTQYGMRGQMLAILEESYHLDRIQCINFLKQSNVLETILVKTLRFHPHGSGLPLYPTLGRRVVDQITVPQEFSKAIETVYPTEYETPVGITSQLLYGRSINTEISRTEMNVGLLRDQMLHRGVMLMGGTNEQRSQVARNMVVANVKAMIPQIIFDTSGDWAQLLPCVDSLLQMELVYLRLGREFSFNLVDVELDRPEGRTTYWEILVDILTSVFRLPLVDAGLLGDTLAATANSSQETFDLRNLISVMTQSLTHPKTRQVQRTQILPNLNELGRGKALLGFRKTRTTVFRVSDILASPKTVIVDVSELPERAARVAIMALLAQMRLMHEYGDLGKTASPPAKVVVMENPESVFPDTKGERGYFMDFLQVLIRPLMNIPLGFFYITGRNAAVPANLLDQVQNFIALRSQNRTDLTHAAELLHCREENSRGATARQRTYQLDALNSLPRDQAMIRRDDFPSPFLTRLELLPPSQSATSEAITQHIHQLLEAGVLWEEEAAPTPDLVLELEFPEYVHLVPPLMDFFQNMVECMNQLTGIPLSVLRDHIIESLEESVMENQTSVGAARKYIVGFLDELIAKGYFDSVHGPVEHGNHIVMYQPSPKLVQVLGEYRAQGPHDNEMESGGTRSDDDQALLQCLAGDGPDEPEDEETPTTGQKTALNETAIAEIAASSSTYDDIDNLLWEERTNDEPVEAQSNEEGLDESFHPEDDPTTDQQILDHLYETYSVTITPAAASIRAMKTRHDAMGSAQVAENGFRCFFQRLMTPEHDQIPTDNALNILFQSAHEYGIPLDPQELRGLLQTIQDRRSVDALAQAVEAFERFNLILFRHLMELDAPEG